MTATWRCDGCGKVANAARNPRTHTRHGQRCGPFTASSVGPLDALANAVRDIVPAPTVDPALRYRVTTLRRYATECPRSTILGSTLTTGSIGTAGDRGSLLHAAIAEVLRTLWRANERRFERTEEAVVILRETAAHGPWVITPDDMFGARNADGTSARSGLVQMISSFAQEEWPVSRFMIIEGAQRPFQGEGRMTADIPCPDGEVRTLSGAPDLVIADPPNGALIIDHKQGMARPVQPREPIPEGQPIRGVQYLTDPQGDYFQLCGYAVLVMTAFPAVKVVTGRERNWRWMGPWREVTIRREDLEHILPYLGTTMMQYDKGMREGEGSELAQPRAGKQCATRCSVKHSCQIPAEARGLGAIDSEAAADEMTRRWRVIRALEPDMRKAIKHWNEETGHCPDAGSGQVARWNGEKGDRKFGFFDPAEPVDPEVQARADAEFVEAMRLQAEINLRERAKA